MHNGRCRAVSAVNFVSRVYLRQWHDRNVNKTRGTERIIGVKLICLTTKKEFICCKDTKTSSVWFFRYNNMTALLKRNQLSRDIGKQKRYNLFPKLSSSALLSWREGLRYFLPECTWNILHQVQMWKQKKQKLRDFRVLMFKQQLLYLSLI